MLRLTLRQKIGIAAALAGVIVTFAAVDDIRIRVAAGRLEREAATLAANAQAAERKAAEAEAIAQRHAARAEFLEDQLKDFRDTAAKQDEKIKELDDDIDSARGRVDRARRIRSVRSDAAGLCEKLERLGHGCVE